MIRVFNIIYSVQVSYINPRARTPSRLCVSTSGARRCREAGLRVRGRKILKQNTSAVTVTHHTGRRLQNSLSSENKQRSTRRLERTNFRRADAKDFLNEIHFC